MQLGRPEGFQLCGTCLVSRLFCYGVFLVIHSLRGEKITSSVWQYKTLIEELTFIDIPMKNGVFSWSDIRGAPATRIDRFLASVLG